MRRALALVVTLASVAAFPAAAPAAQQLGSVGNAGACVENFIYLSPSVAVAPDYFADAPGVITSWSTNVDSDVNPTLAFRVLSSDGGGNYTVLQRDVVRTLQPSVLNVITGLHLPIESGQTIGVFVPPGQQGGNGSCLSNTGAISDTHSFDGGDPPIGTSTSYSAPQNNTKLNLSALVEPDTDRDTFGDETQDKCVGAAGPAEGCPNTFSLGKAKGKGSKVVLSATVPGAGTIVAGAANDNSLRARTAKKKSLLKKITRTLTGTGQQTVRLTLKLTKAAKKKLARAGKLKLRIKVLYTPPGGTAGSQTVKVTLKD